MEDGEQQAEAPLVGIKIYLPYTEEYYNTIIDIDMNFDLKWYYTLEELFMVHGIDSDYTDDEMYPFIDLFAN